MTEPPYDSRLARARESDDQAVRHLYGTMTCPRCGRQLLPSEHAQGIAWRCRGCGGQSLNFSQFRRMVPEHGANAIWESASVRPVPPRRRTLCPECHTGMGSVDLPVNGRAVELDICLPCQRLWLDRQEAMDHAAESASLVVAPPQERRSALRSLLGTRRTRPASVDKENEEEFPEPHRIPVLSIAIVSLAIIFLAVVVGGDRFSWDAKTVFWMIFVVVLVAERLTKLSKL